MTLEPVASASGVGSGYRGAPIRVPAVRVPPELDREEFMQKGAPGELKIDDLVRWSAPLGMLARNTLIMDLSSRLPPGKVSPPDAPAQSAGRRIDVSILSMGIVGGDASLQAAYEFVADDGQSSATYRQWVTLHEATVGRTPLEAARAFSSLLGQLADRIASDLHAAR